MANLIVAILIAVFALKSYANDDKKSPDINSGTWVIDRDKRTMTNEKGESLPFLDPLQEEAEKAKDAEALTPLEEYATALHYHGIRVDEAVKFAGQDYSGLFRMLHDQRYEDSWPTIVHLIGIVGDEKAVDELIAYAEDESNSSISAVKAKAAVQISLGILAGRLKQDRLLQLVAEGLEPEKWSQRKDFNASIDPEAYQYAGVLYSLEGLAAAGTPEAIRVLESYSKRWNSDSSLRAKMKPLRIESHHIDQSIRKAKKVQAKGYLKVQSELEKEAHSSPEGK